MTIASKGYQIKRQPLERTYALLDRLRAEKVTDPDELSRLTTPDLYSKLIAAGYDRGEFITYLCAETIIFFGLLCEELRDFGM